jgi:AGZA family xanthine/uracil permease-like MFS transporter
MASDSGELARPPLAREAIGGVTTFFTMAYIVVVNPGILSTQGTGLQFDAVLTATVLVCFSMTLLMGVYAKLPYAVAPGMGINAFFTYTLVLGQGVPWPTALGLVFWAGVIFLALSVTPVRLWIAKAIPRSLRIGAAGGIGAFLAFIGLKNAGIIVSNEATSVALGKLDGGAVLALIGLFLCAALFSRRVPGALLIGMGVITAAAWTLGVSAPPDALVSAPSFSHAFSLDLSGALSLALLPALVTLVFTDLFDSLSTFVGVSEAAGLVDEEGQPLRVREGLIVDSLATLGAGLFGSSSGTTYIESAAGIESGGRTGWTAVFCALCFLPCLFFAPLLGAIPAAATAPVLILVGALMFRAVFALDVEKLEDALPAFLAVVLIPLTFSITQGILWGFISHVVLYALRGRGREVDPVMYAVATACVGLLILEHAP